MSLLNNNTLQFITLDFVKAHFRITDTQDDNTLLGIIQACNLELKKRILTVIDDISTIPGSIFFQPAQSAALVYCEAEIRRQLNLLHNEAKTTMETFNEMVGTLLGEIRSQAPTRTSKVLSSRDTDFEDDFFAERRFV